MPYDIVIGRDSADKKIFGKKGIVPIGKSYVKMGPMSSLTNPLFLDVARSHVVLVAGKRGSGKSYTLGVIAEGVAKAKANIAFLMIDTMGIYWSMKYPNTKQEALLHDYQLVPEALSTAVYVPTGKRAVYAQRKIPVDKGFSINTNDLDAFDWCQVFGVSPLTPIGILITRVISNLSGMYNLTDILNRIKREKTHIHIKEAATNLFAGAFSWGVFSPEGTPIKDLLKTGSTAILDLSAYDNWNIKCMVLSYICNKLLQERILARKIEEHESITKRGKPPVQETPLIWIAIDEAHEFLPRKGKTPATDALIALLREGRQPGVSLILATQQPGEIHKDVMTQSDVVISHRVTAKFDIEALNNIMQTYLTADLLTHMNDLPKEKGSAIVLDDNSERIYAMRVRPRVSWHGGGTPSAITVEQEW